ncbi:MAG TPA: hypothetical protein VJK90_18330 [Acetobacteraceae bacterium]|nr:hypothetical protein [Acetobacteraceae bacterium]
MIAGMVLVAGLSLTGCKLIDQTTFAPAPEAKPAQVTLPQIDKRAPLVTIGYDQPNPSYQEMLGYAVHAAEERDAGVQYDVFAVVPATGSPAQQVQAAGAAQQDAVGVMKAIMALGVPAARIHLGVRADPAIGVNQVRIYVR